jgi:hypothetical protein
MEERRFISPAESQDITPETAGLQKQTRTLKKTSKQTKTQSRKK